MTKNSDPRSQEGGDSLKKRLDNTLKESLDKQREEEMARKLLKETVRKDAVERAENDLPEISNMIEEAGKRGEDYITFRIAGNGGELVLYDERDEFKYYKNQLIKLLGEDFRVEMTNGPKEEGHNEMGVFIIITWGVARKNFNKVRHLIATDPNSVRKIR